MVCNSALPKGHPQQHVEDLDRANFIRSACPGMDLNKCVMQLASLHEPLKITLPAALRLVQIRLRRHQCLVQLKIARELAGVRNLAKVSLWGARSGLKMTWWSPCDAVELWFFEAEI